jgi:glutamate racemase
MLAKSCILIQKAKKNLPVLQSSIFEGNLYNFSDTEPQRAPIGIFDSGVGGLTVLRQLYRQLPNESIIYFGDTARLPYGIRSQAEIIQYVRDILHWMQQQRVKMVIMACNTSSALALETVRKEFNVPILGLILPGARAAVQQGMPIGKQLPKLTQMCKSGKSAVPSLCHSSNKTAFKTPTLLK